MFYHRCNLYFISSFSPARQTTEVKNTTNKTHQHQNHHYNMLVSPESSGDIIQTQQTFKICDDTYIEHLVTKQEHICAYI